MRQISKTGAVEVVDTGCAMDPFFVGYRFHIKLCHRQASQQFSGIPVPSGKLVQKVISCRQCSAV